MKAHPGYAHINRIRDYDANTKCIVLDAHECDWCEYEYTYVRDPATGVWSMPSHMAREFADILRQLCMAVHYCNWMGVAHCDIKPQNVLCDQDYSKCEVSNSFPKSPALSAAHCVTLGVTFGSTMTSPPKAGDALSGRLRHVHATGREAPWAHQNLRAAGAFPQSHCKTAPPLYSHVVLLCLNPFLKQDLAVSDYYSVAMTALAMTTHQVSNSYSKSYTPQSHHCPPLVPPLRRAAAIPKATHH